MSSDIKIQSQMLSQYIKNQSENKPLNVTAQNPKPTETKTDTVELSKNDKNEKLNKKGLIAGIVSTLGVCAALAIILYRNNTNLALRGLNKTINRFFK